MYTDFFLRFGTEVEGNALLFDEQTNVQGAVVETVLVPKYAAVDVVGTLYKPTGKMIDTDIPEMAPIPGWHANVRHTDAAPGLEAFRVFPETPARLWA